MKSKRGMTLIALIVTIIILLILAGISISFLVGDNGILDKSLDAKKANLEAEQKENMDFNSMEQQCNKYFGGLEEKPTVLLYLIVKVGDYIAYDNTSEWKVMEKATDGIKIISNASTVEQRIGNSGESTSLSYSTATSGLNQVANNMKNKYADSARSVVYSDIANLTSLNELKTGEAYWIANTYTYGNQYHVGVIDENGILHQNTYNDSYSLVGWNATQYATMNIIHDVRIIVNLLKTSMTNCGDGSKENPYILCEL